MTSSLFPALSISALILAAGRGERMRPLTDVLPKPLLPVRGKPLMQWPLEALVHAGFDDLVVNTAWLGDQIESQFGASCTYSHEGRDFGHALETAGGIVRCLPRLGPVFWVLAGDVFAPDFVFSQDAVARFKASGKLAHLWLVPNPAHNPLGDFGLSPEGLAQNLPKGNAPTLGVEKYTFSTIGLYQCALFTPPYCEIAFGNPDGIQAALAPLLRLAMDQQQVSAEIYQGEWTDVGTPERLKHLNTAIFTTNKSK